MYWTFRLDIMAATSTQLESAYDKILRWCSFEFRELKREVQVEVEPTMTEAVRRLSQRPELLRFDVCAFSLPLS
jgi:hypothetical protein